jgi:hypothetical protein
MTIERHARRYGLRQLGLAGTIWLCCLASCPDTRSPGNPSDLMLADEISDASLTAEQPGTSTYDVTLAQDARLVAATTVETKLIEVSNDRSRFRFADSAADVQSLQVDQVVIFAGQGVRRVSAISSAPGEIVVDTVPASLNEAILEMGVSRGKDRLTSRPSRRSFSMTMRILRSRSRRSAAPKSSPANPKTQTRKSSRSTAKLKAGTSRPNSSRP